MKFKITLASLTTFLNKVTKLLIPLVVASLLFGILFGIENYNIPLGFVIDGAHGGAGMNANTGIFASVFAEIGYLGLFLFSQVTFAQSLNNLSFGDTNNLNIITWNLEWFAKYDQTTIDSLSVAISALDVDVIAVQEISDVSEFLALINQLNGYSGYYSVSNCSQILKY